ncbi:hypothetical protein QTO34_000776 [Cnephaeus nilssonii]|uniref:MAGE domain-containing protein n=1 Tax=Cnephaeus nilssonii TaxID=3371016 RepID=A0AA40ICM5_CNENI|nr:hypothetical protein QTO34_000776 [Eptesicus nilssonii]
MDFPQKNPQCLPDELLQTHSETQGLEVAQDSKALEEACLSSHPAIPGNLKEAPDAGITSTSESAQGFCSSSIITTVSSSSKYGEGCTSEEEEDSTLEADPDPKNVPIDALDENVASLVNFLLLKYQMNELITKAEMLKIVSKGNEDHFIEIFLRTFMRMEIIFGLDLKEVDLTNHCYAIFIKMGLTYVGMLHDKKGMPKTGILILILAVIFMKGNRSTEEEIWQFLKLNDDKWDQHPDVFTDLSVHINELNLKLQGFGKSIDVMFGYIKAFESKVKIFKRDVETKTYKYFPRVTKYFEKAIAAVQNEMELLHMKYQHVLDSLLDQFSDRFSQFRSLEQTMKIIKYPDVVVYSSLELNGFQWMQIDDLEMQLAEFQDSIWAQVFVDWRSKLENLERCRLENQEECHYEQEIWSAWNRLPDTFSTLKNRAMALLTIFPLHTFVRPYSQH